MHNKINYVEFPARDMDATKAFFAAVFGWGFTDYGEDYAAINEAGLDGGFYRADHCASVANGSVLVVIYSENLEDSLERVKKHGGEIIKDIFAFPGGRRFHFSEPSGNEFAIWSDA
ncbi:VOC family protein [Aestuariibacter sp. AA17]|uniref:VOC family protein n=1 Tax=Fluctibacter corallii TaxID=2984329 RepID=A0ABT3A5P7_9ALTE|nr:VOC family protein [Aestuariibacter sp. AA17]MCV2884013.1 VOC family protein [Aestuariibacter sp. AA17]